MICTKCKEDSPATVEFWQERQLERGLNGKYCWCKGCTRAYDNKRYKKPNRWAQRALRNAAIRNGKEVEVSVTPDYIEKIWPKDSICPLREVPMVVAEGILGGQDDSPSLHRKNPNKGYIKGNIAIVSRLANRIMCHANKTEIKKVAKNMPASWGKL